MPNGHDPNKEYGPHDYPEGSGNCKHGCGCWMGSSQSDGPIGLDPFGECPKNPRDGKFLGGLVDYRCVVEKRIRNLESRASTAETALEKVSPSKKKLAEKLQRTKKELAEANQLIIQIDQIMGTRS